MYFNNQHFTYAINTNENTRNMDLGVSIPSNESPKSYFRNVDGTLVVFSHLVPNQTFQQFPLIEDNNAYHHAIATPQTSGTMMNRIKFQMNPQAQNSNTMQAQLHEVNTQSILVEQNPLPCIIPESMKTITDVSVANNASSSISTLNNLWCLICDKSLTSSDSIDIVGTVTTATGRTLKTVLKRLTSLNIKRLLSHVLCPGCYALVNEFDILELKLADTEMKITKSLQSTLRVHHADIFLKVKDKKVMLSECKSSESSDDSSMYDNDDNPNVTEESSLMQRKRKRRSCKKSNCKEIQDLRNFNSETVRKEETNKKENMEETRFLCTYCEQLVDLSSYLAHVMKHRMLPCPFCQMPFRRKELKDHLVEVHKNESKFPCFLCDKTFDSFFRLHQHWSVIHKEISSKKEFSCFMCSEVFSSSSDLKFHVDSLHMNNNQYQCHICKECFTQKGNMQNHIRRLHSSKKTKKFVCPNCDKKFFILGDLRKHINYAHLRVKNITCSICSKEFIDSRSLKVHMNAIHTKEVEYPCSVCAMVFYSRNNMLTHRRRIHFSYASRKYLCNTCGKRFCSPSDLQTHVRVVHENIRLYICDICNKSFKVASNLKYHRRKHSGEMPHPCPHCPKSFRSPTHMSNHVKKVHKTTYLGEREKRILSKLTVISSLPQLPQIETAVPIVDQSSNNSVKTG